MMCQLHEVTDAEHFGGKAAQLGHARRAGLPVPAGFAVSPVTLDHVLAGQDAALQRLLGIFQALAGPVAVRSSAIDEDGAHASFAGQHATVLNVADVDGLLEALRTVHASARTPAALAYRARLQLPPEPKMAVIVQTLVPSDRAGVMFTRNPMTGADERVIEATWGLGEAVVAGLVTPDRYRVERGGRVLERSAGDKDIAIRQLPGGATEEVEVDPEMAAALCLSDADLRMLDQLATDCESHFSGAHDIEWAFSGETLHLLQRRAITRG